MLFRFPRKHSTAGFTLVEMITVMVMIGILAAIAAPGWLRFMNTRRATEARDQILQALRQAQAEAIRTRSTMFVDFDREVNPPKISLDRPDDEPPLQTQQLGETSGRSPDGYFLPPFTNGRAVDGIDCDEDCIAFDGDGVVLNMLNNSYIDGTVDESNASEVERSRIIINVKVPNENGTSRCVIIQTLLGSMRAGNGDDECDA
ncbi:MAG: prepilin-type N-terminal cleavage/methylation domain-containing protein [Cyanobacteria bacterium CRU_2_1]|nr:prepilin-type N-terminal cleavage/methylation domain-containing protein [Cyanobacteria bacterium RU_5_0]NJR59097.1 prepilin-type N-terminal cleavage/methylation domain-containing protein [Cyanobacteria bacterium CRU_2_1]